MGGKRHLKLSPEMMRLHLSKVLKYCDIVETSEINEPTLQGNIQEFYHVFSNGAFDLSVWSASVGAFAGEPLMSTVREEDGEEEEVEEELSSC